MTTPKPALEPEQRRLTFEYSALRAGLGQGRNPKDFFFTAAIKIVTSGTTEMRFPNPDPFPGATHIMLRYSDKTDIRAVTTLDTTAGKRDLNIVDPGVKVVELHANADLLNGRAVENHGAGRGGCVARAVGRHHTSHPIPSHGKKQRNVSHARQIDPPPPG